MFDRPEFINIPALDLDNKLILPTLQLYQKIEFKLSALYQDIRSILVDAHTYLADVALQWYKHPRESFTATYDRFENDFLPKADAFYQHWEMQAMAGVDQVERYLQAFWDNPEQTTQAMLEPVSCYFASATEQTERYWQSFIDNPEQFAVDAMAIATNYLASFTDSIEVILISSYYTLLELFQILMAQPSAALQALYANTLSRLLDTYYDLISSLLIMV